MDFLFGLFRCIFEYTRSLYADRQEEKELKRGFKHFTSFAAYWYIFGFHTQRGSRKTREIILKLSLPSISSFEDAMFVAENSFKPETVRFALEKAHSLARTNQEFKLIREKTVNFFGAGSLEARAIIEQEDYVSALVRKYLTMKG